MHLSDNWGKLYQTPLARIFYCVYIAIMEQVDANYQYDHLAHGSKDACSSGRAQAKAYAHARALSLWLQSTLLHLRASSMPLV